MFLKAIAAEFLIAAMVWLIPSADTAQIQVVTLVTYPIAVGGMDIIAGNMEAIMLVANGTLTQDATGTLVMLTLEAPGLERVMTEVSTQYVDQNLLHVDNLIPPP